MKPNPTTIRDRAEGSIPKSILSEGGGLFTRKYLSTTTLYDLLEEDEQVEYVYANRSNGFTIERQGSPDTESVTPTNSYLAFAALTDQRAIFAAGGDDGDEIITVPGEAIESARIDSSILTTSLVLETSTETYTFRVKKRHSSSTKDGVQFVESILVPIVPSSTDTQGDTNSSPSADDGDTGVGPTGVETGVDASAEKSASDNSGEEHDEQPATETPPEAPFVADYEAIPPGVQEDLREAAELIENAEPENGAPHELKNALETAEELLSDYPDFAGVDGDAVEEALRRIASQHDSLSTISGAQSKAERKLVLAENGPPIRDEVWSELAAELREAIEESDSLGRSSDNLHEKLEQVEAQIDQEEPTNQTAESGESAVTEKPQQAGTQWTSGEGESEEKSAEEDSPKYSTTPESSKKPSRDELLEELERIHEEFGKRTSSFLVRKHAAYDPQQFETEFGSISEALSTLADPGDVESTDDDKETTDDDDGMTDETSSDSTENTNPATDAESPTRADILASIKDGVADTGELPRLYAFTSQSDIDSSDVYRHFDSWDDALDAAGVEGASREELVENLRQLESDLGHPPLSPDVDKHSRYNAYDYQQEFGSIRDALEEADIDLEGYIVETLADLLEGSEGEPTMSDFAAAAPYSQSLIYKFFNSWDDALEAAANNDSPPRDDGVESSPDDEGESDSERNGLSELYEQVRNLNELCQAVIEAKESFGTSGENPMDTWAATVREFYSTGPEGADSYGAQQQDQNPFSMKDYRSKFGDGARVTEFEAVETGRPTPSLQALLDTHLERSAEDYSLPVDPRSGDCLPVLVQSPEELESAQAMLSRLPTNPEPSSRPESKESDHQTPDDLTELNGVTEEISAYLRDAGYEGFEAVSDASMDELEAVDGLNKQTAMRIKLNMDMESILPESE